MASENCRFEVLGGTLEGLPWDNWTHYIRGRDFIQVSDLIPIDGRSRSALEIGFGDGYVTTLLRQRFGLVVPIDIRPSGTTEGMFIGTAEAFPFSDEIFDFVYSSNALEHVEDIDACMREMSRVLRDDGLMIHTMPTQTWKFLNIAMCPLSTLRRALKWVLKTGRLTARTPGRHDDLRGRSVPDTRGRPSIWRRLPHAVVPHPHGPSKSNLEEWTRFSAEYWRSQFARHGLKVCRVVPLFFHSGYRFLPYKMMSVRKRIADRGFACTNAYIVRKAGYTSPEATISHSDPAPDSIEP